jgi:hypothetical protein
MHGPINVKSPNNPSKWQMGFNSAFKGLMKLLKGYCWSTALCAAETYLHKTNVLAFSIE